MFNFFRSFSCFWWFAISLGRVQTICFSAELGCSSVSMSPSRSRPSRSHLKKAKRLLELKLWNSSCDWCKQKINLLPFNNKQKNLFFCWRYEAQQGEQNEKEKKLLLLLRLIKKEFLSVRTRKCEMCVHSMFTYNFFSLLSMVEYFQSRFWNPTKRTPDRKVKPRINFRAKYAGGLFRIKRGSLHSSALFLQIAFQC